MAAVSKESDDKMCSTCEPKKTAAITSCHGCDHHFCRKHFNEHRDQLSKYLNNHVDLHDEIRQDLKTRINRSSDDQLNNDDAKKLLRQIDEWVERTIDACLRVADEARASVKELFDKTKDNDSLTQRLLSVARELEEQQESENFVERDLDRWMKQLKELKDEISRPIQFPTDITIEIQDINWEESVKICQQSNSNNNAEHYVLVLGEKGAGKTTFIHYVANYFANKHSFNDRLSQTTIELSKKTTVVNSHDLAKQYTIDRYSFSIDNETVLVFFDFHNHMMDDTPDIIINSAANLVRVKHFVATVVIGDGTDMEEDTGLNDFLTRDLLEFSEVIQENDDFCKHFSVVFANSSPDLLNFDCSTINIYDNISYYFMQNSAYQLYKARSVTDTADIDYRRSMETVEQIVKKIVHKIRHQT